MADDDDLFTDDDIFNLTEEDLLKAALITENGSSSVCHNEKYSNQSAMPRLQNNGSMCPVFKQPNAGSLFQVDFDEIESDLDLSLQDDLLPKALTSSDSVNHIGKNKPNFNESFTNTSSNYSNTLISHPLRTANYSNEARINCGQELRTPTNPTRPFALDCNSEIPRTSHVTIASDAHKTVVNRQDSLPMNSSSTSSENDRRRKRKFPGPAGALPKLKEGMSFDQVIALKPVLPSDSTSDRVSSDPHTSNIVASVPPSSQSSVQDVFQNDLWLTMRAELEDDVIQLLANFNLSVISKKAKMKQLPSCKVPVVCAVIESVNINGLDASVILRDMSGTIPGTLHRELLREHAEHIHAGTVLVLRQVGVLCPTLGRNCYLNITPNNVVRLYANGNDSDGPLVVRVREFTRSDLVLHERQIHPNSTLNPASSTNTPVSNSTFSVMNSSVTSGQTRPAAVHSLRQPLVSIPNQTFSKPLIVNSNRFSAPLVRPSFSVPPSSHTTSSHTTNDSNAMNGSSLNPAKVTSSSMSVGTSLSMSRTNLGSSVISSSKSVGFTGKEQSTTSSLPLKRFHSMIASSPTPYSKENFSSAASNTASTPASRSSFQFRKPSKPLTPQSFSDIGSQKTGGVSSQETCLPHRTENVDSNHDSSQHSDLIKDLLSDLDNEFMDDF